MRPQQKPRAAKTHNSDTAQMAHGILTRAEALVRGGRPPPDHNVAASALLPAASPRHRAGPRPAHASPSALGLAVRERSCLSVPLGCRGPSPDDLCRNVSASDTYLSDSGHPCDRHQDPSKVLMIPNDFSATEAMLMPCDATCTDSIRKSNPQRRIQTPAQV